MQERRLRGHWRGSGGLRRKNLCPLRSEQQLSVLACLVCYCYSCTEFWTEVFWFQSWLVTGSQSELSFEEKALHGHQSTGERMFVMKVIDICYSCNSIRCCAKVARAVRKLRRPSADAVPNIRTLSRFARIFSEHCTKHLLPRKSIATQQITQSTKEMSSHQHTNRANRIGSVGSG